MPNQILSFNRHSDCGIDNSSLSPSLMNYASSIFGKSLIRGASNTENIKFNKLLIVDDSEFIQKLLIMVVERLRASMMVYFDIIQANNGEEGY